MSDKKFNSLKENLKNLQHFSSPGWHREVLEEREKYVREDSMAFEDRDCVKRELFEMSGQRWTHVKILPVQKETFESFLTCSIPTVDVKPATNRAIQP